MQIAIGHKGQTTVTIWCDVERTEKDGTIHFSVINGGWNGCITPAGKVKVGDDDELHDGTILWRGKAPFSWRHYNEAIAWLDEQIRSGVTFTPLPNQWTETLEEDGEDGDLIVPVPTDLIEQMGWAGGDTLIWTLDPKSGQVILTHTPLIR